MGGDDEISLRRRLDELSVEYELVRCDPALADTATFCAAYGYHLDDSANTIIVVGKTDPPRYAACVALATTRLDVNRAVRRRLGAKKASFAGAGETQSITGMAIGGVTPFGLPRGLPVWVDHRVMSLERVVLGGGSRNWKVVCSPQVLLRLPDADVVRDLARDEEDRGGAG